MTAGRPGAHVPYLLGFFLAAAVAAGGLRGDAGWLVFGTGFLAWFAASGRRLSAEGLTAPVLFFAWMGAAAVFSPDPLASAPVFGRYALLGLAFFAASSSGEESRSGWLAAVYVLGAAAAAGLLGQRLAGQPLTGFIGGNPNYSAAFCAAAFPAALLSAAAGSHGRETAQKALLALLLAAGVLASGSRGALLAAFVSAASGLAAARRWRLLAAFAVLAVGAAALLPREGWEGLFKFSDPRAFERPRLWLAAARAAEASPLLGWGPGLFVRAFELFKFPFFDGISYFGHGTLHAHGELFNLAAEAGFPAAVFFAATAGTVLLRRGTGNLPVKLCALSVLLQGSADMIFYSGAVGLLYWGSLGFAWRARALPEERPARLPRLLAAAVTLALLALPFAAGFASGGLGFLRVSYLEARSGGGPFLARALLAFSEAAEPFNPFPAEAEGRLRMAAKDLAGAELAFSRALRLEPGFAAAGFGLASVYAASGNRKDACQLLAGLEKKYPEGPESEYQKRLLSYDEAAAKELKKEICGNRKTGGATAPGRKTR
ncbi:MAG: tetratricopeptide repeat protein [Elusimicrobia bacterium]|nr:tetratricopeptide repeat protein [Elusimicrobiota bacterium]